MPRPVARITPPLLSALLGACASVGDAGRLTAPTTAVADAGDAAGGTRVRWSCATRVDPASHPLYVVDGRLRAATELTPLQPDDVDTIEVLKGPRAAAIYGAGAEGGVIVITTRRGRTAGRPPAPVSPAS